MRGLSNLMKAGHGTLVHAPGVLVQKFEQVFDQNTSPGTQIQEAMAKQLLIIQETWFLSKK